MEGQFVTCGEVLKSSYYVSQCTESWGKEKGFLGLSMLREGT